MQTDRPTKATNWMHDTQSQGSSQSPVVINVDRDQPQMTGPWNDWALEQSCPGQPPLATMSSGEAGKGLS